MCVIIFVTALEYKPPIARTPPIIASLSPLGRSAQHTTRPEKKYLGSGLYWRGFASRPFATDAFTQSGLTTAFRALMASS